MSVPRVRVVMLYVMLLAWGVWTDRPRVSVVELQSCSAEYSCNARKTKGGINFLNTVQLYYIVYTTDYH